jgi:hypothetical protein
MTLDICSSLEGTAILSIRVTQLQAEALIDELIRNAVSGLPI